MKMRNKGKVHPLISSSSSSSYSASNDVLSVLKQLPAAIFALLSLLSFEDREVLAYMISRSLKSTNLPSFAADDKKKSQKNSNGHKPPASFDCDCFYCYTSFWSRWDSSPNRELIHQAIEAFEEHLINGEHSRKSNNGKRKKEKLGRRKSEKIADGIGVLDFPATEGKSNSLVSLFPVPGTEVEVLVSAPKEDDVAAECGESEVKEAVVPKEEEEVVSSPPSIAVVHSHKGLARKVLPDVLGLFNSRLWGLWNPNV